MTEPPPINKLPSFVALAIAFLTIGTVSFGGGRAVYFQDELVRRRGWITDDEFLEAVAISQILPGPNVGNLSSYLGQRLLGWRGSVIAVLAFVLPGSLAILALGWLYFGGMPVAISGPIGRGVSAAATGIGCSALLRLRGAAQGIPGWTVAILAFVLFGPLGWPIVYVLLLCLPVSFVLLRMQQR